MWRYLLLFILLSTVTLAQELDLGPELVRPAIRHSVQDRVFYFVLPDRFRNGNPDNDRGGLSGGPLQHGFLPVHKEYYHGGDLAGLGQSFDYLKGLGVNALWLTPIMANRPVQGDGTINGSIAGYHGYWILDFENPDPHLGTAEELRGLVDAAHAQDFLVYFDMVANHTADVINYGKGPNPYVSKATSPYRDAQGQAFDDSEHALGPYFPTLNPQSSFPITPLIDPKHAHAKNPAWLNRPEYYHNRGDWTPEAAGETAQYGDFYGLDDLFTEHPRVVTGFTDIFNTLIEKYDIDGFRVDTVRHVNTEFWQLVVPRVLDYANRSGKSHFFMFGEVYDSNPRRLSPYTRDAEFPSVLDFGLQAAISAFAVDGGSPQLLEEFFLQDDLFTDADSNAQLLGAFISNHDMGRLGGFLQKRLGGEPGEEHLARAQLAHAMVYFARGFPIIYYGDEQGFVSEGAHADARGDMFPSQTPEYLRRKLIGTQATMGDDNFDPEHPLYQSLAHYGQLFHQHRALRRGAQIHRSSENLYAFSRIDRDEQVEYVIAFNNSKTTQKARFPVYTPEQAFELISEEGPALRSDSDSQLSVTVNPLSYVIYRAKSPLAVSSTPRVATLKIGKETVTAALDQSNRFVEVTFAVQVGDGPRRVLGTDDNPPYRVFTSPPEGPATYYAVVNDLRGGLSTAIKASH